MPANLPPEALAAREKYESAITLNEKIKALQKYISTIPKHKGTEKLLDNLKKRLSKLKLEKERRKSIGKSSGGTSEYSIKKEGAGQIVIIGLTNSGKSSLLNLLAGREVAKVDMYEFTTKKPEIAMVPYEDIKFQIIENTPLYEGCNENREQFTVIRNCDLLLLVVDLSKDPDYQVKVILDELNKVNIRINYRRRNIKVARTGMGGIVIIHKGIRIENERQDIIKILHDNGIHNARVVINEKIESIEELRTAIKEAIRMNIAYKNGIIVATKGDIIGSSKNFKILKENWGDRFPIIPVSSVKNIGCDELKEAIFRELGIIRIYTREPSKKISPKPLIIKKGGTVEIVAKKLGQNFLKEFKYAYLYRRADDGNKRMERRRVGLYYELMDKDIIQIYT